MRPPKKKGTRVCVSQVACEGNTVSHTSPYDDCLQCRTKQQQKAKPPKPLRGQHCIDTYERRL